MTLFLFLFVSFLQSIVSYSEIRIYQEQIKERIIPISSCKTTAPGYKNELTFKGYFITLSSLHTLNITSIQKLFSPNLFLIIDNKEIDSAIESILNQFSVVFLQKELYNNRNIFQSQAFLCQISHETIKDLSTYNILSMSSHYHGELYYTEYYYSPSFIYTSSLSILIYSCLMIIPKVYFALCKITDPFQKIWLISYVLLFLMSIILFFQAKSEIEFYNISHLKPQKTMVYYLLVHLDSLFKAYTMTMLIALANGLYFDYPLELKESGWYLILFTVLQILFGLDDILNYSLKNKSSHFGYSLIQMMLELKDLLLFSFLVKIVLARLRMMEVNLFNELIHETTLSQQQQRNIEIKLNYVKKAKGTLSLFLMFLCIMVVICKSGLSVFITGIIVPIIKIISDLCLLTTVNIIFYPKHLPNKLWLNIIGFNNEYMAKINEAIDVCKDNTLARYYNTPYAIINPFSAKDQLMYDSIKIGYL